jgi:putative flavoprotein involved in K+ transport
VSEQLGVVVVGAGQAGLAVSCELTHAGVEHVVLERGKVGQTWRGRWDSFCLVTPNWSVQLPGHPYDRDQPDGYMHRDEIVSYLERYAAGFEAPVREGVTVTSLESDGDGGLLLGTSAGQIHARKVVLCTGAYQRPHRPPAAATLPEDLPQLDAEGYRNPSELPPGPVLVIGSGQTGCQIAEELHLAGRSVFLACGRAPWAPRRIGGRDLVWWLVQSGYVEASASSLPNPEARLAANVQASGHGGGHDLHYRTLQQLGVTLLGHFAGADGRHARFATDLAETVVWGDERNDMIMGLVDKVVAERGMAAPENPPRAPIDTGTPDHVDLTGFGAVIFTAGFRPDYETWVRCPGAFDALGFPVHEDCASTVSNGLYFAGVHFLRKRKSSLLIGVGEDAAIVARQITGSLSGQLSELAFE